MWQEELCRDRCMGLLLAEYMRDMGVARPNAKTLCTGSVLKRLSHNSKFQQKESRTGRYTKKQASDFAKYLIMGQPLKSGVW
jgi:hypothetical protein